MEKELEQLKKMRSEAEEIFRRSLRPVDPGPLWRSKEFCTP